MNFKRDYRWLPGLLAIALGVELLGTAQFAQGQDQDQAPGSGQGSGQGSGEGTGQPARAVRLSYVDGQVTLAQGGQVLAQQAVANTPLLEGMQLTTADSGKAEIQFEDGSVVRLSPDSSVTLQVLEGAGTTANAVLLLNSGLAYFEFQGGGQAGQMSVQFGDSQVTTSGFTLLRVSMDNPPGQVAVFSGNAHLESAGGNVATDLHGGESITLNGASPANYQLAESIEPDSWDAWNSDRDQAMSAEAASQSPASANLGESQNPAWNDLDANGNWYDVPGQGYIWSPYEASSADFDPYGYGNWMWTPGYGYLWVSGYPWGYMPFQCGAWNYFNGFGWGWAPGSGGCSPWWGSGFYGGPRFGARPPGYRVIPRPILPRRPIGGRPIAMIAVNHSPVIAGSPLPARNRNTPVTIGGRTVVPLRPLPTRPVIVQAPPTPSRNQPQPENQGPIETNRPVAPSRPGYNLNRPVSQEPTEPTRPSYNLNRPATQQPGEPNRPEQPQPGERNRPAQMTPPETYRPAPQPAYRPAAPAQPPVSQPQPSHNPPPSPPSYQGGGSGNRPSGGGSSGGGSPHPSGGSYGGGGGGGSRGGGGGGGGGGSRGGGGSSSGHH